jgi:MYXO-CTERM domain-containing protein
VKYLIDLIERSERARGRDPWLNRDIEVALGRGRNCDNEMRQRDAYAMPLHRDDYYVAPAYTTSFDAALTLLPRDMMVSLHPFEKDGERRWNVGLVRLEDDDPPQGWQGYGAAPALALCAAALRSRRRDALHEGRGDEQPFAEWGVLLGERTVQK